MNLGISLYLHLLAKDFDLEAYLLKCKNNNIKIIFTTLINFKNDDKNLFNKFQQLLQLSQKLDLDICVDINQELLQEFKLENQSYESVFNFFDKQLKIKMLRFDEGFSIEQLQIFSFNKNDIKIIINASNPVKELKSFLSLKPNIKNLIACYNFYPQRYTANSLQDFLINLNFLHNSGVKVQAFVTLQRKDTTGPWPFADKLPSLEMHRDLELDYQIRHLQAMQVDDVIIANQFVNDQEFMIIKNFNQDKVKIKVHLLDSILTGERDIIEDKDIHEVRKDMSEYILRSTLSRIKYQTSKIESTTQQEYFLPGDVLILNSNSKNYKGELQIVLKKIKNDGIRNLVAKLESEELQLVSLLQPNQKFYFEIE